MPALERAARTGIGLVVASVVALLLVLLPADSTAVGLALSREIPSSQTSGKAPVETGGSSPAAPDLEEISKRSVAEQKAYFQKRLAANALDTNALEGLARVEAGLRNYPAAIAAYRRVLELLPNDRDAATQLARLLGWNGEYESAIRAFGAVLDRAPEDREALEGLARVQVWSGKLAAAAATYSRLAAGRPDDTHDLFEAARLESETRQYPAARERLTSLLAVEPGNLDARLLLAQLELKQGQYASSLRQFERVLERRPRDLAALLGAAQTRYYTGDQARAEAEAGEVVAQQPRNFDALFLLASIERARGRRAQARAALRQAEQAAPHNPELTALRERLWAESSTVLHVTAGYSREIGIPVPADVLESTQEDLRSLTFGTRLDFVALPRSTSSVSFDALPTTSPSGGLRGAVVPAEYLYRQTTRVDSRLTLRGSLGLERFGPGAYVQLPQGGGPLQGARTAPAGFFGGTYKLSERVNFDLTWSHLGRAYTPLATRLGVVSTRLEGGVNFSLDSHTAFHLTYFEEHLASEPYWHRGPNALVAFLGPSTRDRESGSGGTLQLNRGILHTERIALDMGGSVSLFGYDGPQRNVYLGFFTPKFYQREMLTSRVHGDFSKRVGYDVSTGLGVQQVDVEQVCDGCTRSSALRRALTVNPALIFKITPYLSCRADYTHYDSTQSLGVVRGNGVQLGFDWKF